MAKRLVLQCINGVSLNPVEGRTKILQLKDLILTLFGLIFRRLYKHLCRWQPYNISVPLDLKVTCDTRLILNIYIRLKIKPNSAKITSLTWQINTYMQNWHENYLSRECISFVFMWFLWTTIAVHHRCVRNYVGSISWSETNVVSCKEQRINNCLIEISKSICYWNTSQ
jgi:hypothetical protein